MNETQSMLAPNLSNRIDKAVRVFTVGLARTKATRPLCAENKKCNRAGSRNNPPEIIYKPETGS